MNKFLAIKRGKIPKVHTWKYVSSNALETKILVSEQWKWQKISRILFLVAVMPKLSASFLN